MNRATKNKRKKNKKKDRYYYKNKYENKSDEKDNEDENNAAPVLKDIKEEEGKNLGPPVDVSLGSYNNCLDILNKMQRLELKFDNNEYELEEAKPLKLMKKVNEEDFLLNYIHYNCFILLEITSVALPIASLQFYADDENNNRMLISVYNFHGFFTAYSFKQGNYIIVKEPFYKQYLDGQIGIRVDNPNNVILFGSKEEANEYIKKEKQ
jgi:hypothetical protein